MINDAPTTTVANNGITTTSIFSTNLDVTVGNTIGNVTGVATTHVTSVTDYNGTDLGDTEPTDDSATDSASSSAPVGYKHIVLHDLIFLTVVIGHLIFFVEK